MAAVHIRTLLHPPNDRLSSERALALLNDRFATLDQLNEGNALEDLIDNSRALSEELNSNLALSKEQTDRLVSETRSEAQLRLNYAQELSLLRNSLSDELSSLSQELVSSTRGQGDRPTLLEELETLQRSLKELENVKAYVQVIERALKLSELSVKEIEQSQAMSESSVSTYKDLQNFVTSVTGMCEHAEDGTGQIKLVSFLETVREQTWSDIKGVLSSSLLAAAEKLHWPMRIDYAAVQPQDRQEFEKAFMNLLKLQNTGERLYQRPTEHQPLFNAGLYPIQALIRPVSLRFKYHFEGSRQTNKLDKPEWYFAHILNVSHEHRQFMDNVIQPLLQLSEYRRINAWREFTRLLLSILSRKIKRSIPTLLPYPSLLAHTVYQSLAFDNALREAGFGISGTFNQENTDEPSDEWDGASDMILGRREWFDAWLDGEKKFVEDQYNDIISSSDAWQLVDDGDEDRLADRDASSTNSARRLKALVEQITDRYRPLPKFLHKTRFLIAVQVPILELYHTRISESLDAFETLSSFIVRAVPGALAGQSGHGQDSKRMTSGVEGVQRLIKALVSANYITSAMSAWGEELFFLELWTTICQKATLGDRVRSHPSLPDPDNVRDEGTIFEELVSQYTKLAERSENMIIRQICGEVEGDLKKHLYRNNEDVVPRSDSGDIGLSPTLAAPISRLSSHLSFLRKVLSQPTVVVLYRRIASEIATYILQRGILHFPRGRMSVQEGRLILEECNLWLEACRLALRGSVRRIEGPWQKLQDAGKLLSLETDVIQRALNVASSGSDRDFEQILEKVGIGELSRNDVVEVAKAREDCSP